MVMKYLSVKSANTDRLGERVHVKATRRDLLKQLVAMSALTGASLMQSQLGFATTGRTKQNELLLQSTSRSDAGYEALRQGLTWKPNIPARYPDIIVQAASEKEVVWALAFAHDNNMQVVTRCSGHNIDTLRDGGMLLDISPMHDFSIDKTAMQASIQPALISFLFQAHLARQGLSFPVPDCHTVALGGYLLGGGYSSMGFYWGDGPACYSILAADVVLADGTKLRVSEKENSDIFWAVRGIGPGFFGVVTRLELQLYPMPAVFMQSNYHYPLDELEAITQGLAQLEEQKSQQVLLALVMYKPEGTSEPPTLKLNVRALGNSEAEVRELLSVYSNIAGNRVTEKNEYQPSNYGDFMYNPSRSERNFSDNIWTDDRSVMSAIVDKLSKMPEHSSFISTLYSDRQLSRLRDDSCFSARGRHFMSHHMFWQNAAYDPENREWYEDFCSTLWPYATSYYVNQMEGTKQAERMKACFSEENWKRLGELRRKYDPERRFFAHMGWN